MWFAVTILARSDYETEITTCSLGLNESLDMARPGQCAPGTLNVWAPKGVVESRPGYTGSYVRSGTGSSTALDNEDVIVENPIGTFVNTDTLSSLPAGSRWYIVFTNAITTDGVYRDGLQLTMTTANSNLFGAACEYWNGTTWMPLRTNETTAAGILGPHLANTNQAVNFVWPRDMGTTTITASGGNATGYAFRFTVIGDSATDALDSDVVFSGTATAMTTSVTTFALGVFQFPSVKKYLSVSGTPTSSNSHFWSAQLGAVETAAEFITATDFQYNISEPASYALVPQFGEVYMAYDRKVVHYTAFTAPTAATLLATVETDPTLVGSGAAYDPTQVAQLGSWPPSKYIAFFKGQLWAANLDDNGAYSIRWSAPSPAYKVWPTVNIEVVMETDNSPISGLYGYNQNMVVFKNDSMWQMVDTGISDAGLQTYSPERIPGAVGTVSQGGVTEVKGLLVFPAEDGLYGWDGAGEPRKLTLDPENGSDRLVETWARITPGRRPFMTAVNWTTQGCYLLAVSLDGSDTNNYVIVWDYERDAFWLWNDIEAQYWLLDEGAYDNQRLFFADQRARVFELGSGKTSHGAAITATVVSDRLTRGYENSTIREVRITSRNTSRSLGAEVLTNDETSGQSGTIDFTDDLEAEWGTGVWGTAEWVADRRREERLGFRRTGDWHQTKITHSTKNTKLDIAKIKVGFIPRNR